MHGHAVMGELGVQEGAEHAPLWGPCVEDLQSGGVASYLHQLGAAQLKCKTQLHGDQTQGPELIDELGGYYGVEC